MAQTFQMTENARPTTIPIANGINGSGNDTVDGIFEDEVDGRPAVNRYAARKTFINSLFDVALVMANVSQLKAVLDQGREELVYYHLQLACIIASIVLQLIFAIVMLWMWCIERRLERQCHRHVPNQRRGTSTAASTPEQNGCCCGPSDGRSKCCSSETANLLDEIGLVLVLLTIILNIVIAGFGISGSSALQKSAINQYQINNTIAT